VTPPRWLYWPASAAAWAPTDLTSLQCWLDASDSSTITESGGSISLWEDKTTNGNDADDAVNTSNVKITTQRPTVATAAQNGLDAVNFNGSQWFDHNTARGMLKDRSCALMAVAMKYGSLPNSFQFAWTNRSTAGSTPIVRFQMIHEQNKLFAVYSMRLDADTASEIVNTNANPPYNTNWHIHLAVLDWAADTLSYYIDGSLIGTDSYPSGGANTSNTDLPTTHSTWTAIGNANRSGAVNLPLSSGSRIGELICGAISSGSYATSDREKLEGYLAHKWGLESNLPNSHPYRYSAP
jgi:hypothetical protein